MIIALGILVIIAGIVSGSFLIRSQLNLNSSTTMWSEPLKLDTMG